MINNLQKICFLLEAIYQLLKQSWSPLIGRKEVQVSDSEPDLMEDKQLYINDVCRILNVRRSTYYRFVKRLLLKPRFIGDRPFYYMQDLKDLIIESGRKGRR